MTKILTDSDIEALRQWIVDCNREVSIVADCSTDADSKARFEKWLYG